MLSDQVVERLWTITGSDALVALEVLRDFNGTSSTAGGGGVGVHGVLHLLRKGFRCGCGDVGVVPKKGTWCRYR